MKRYSTSKLKTFEACKLQYKNHYIDEIEIPDIIPSADTSFGSYIHKVAEIYNGKNNKEIASLIRSYPLNAEYRKRTLCRFQFDGITGLFRPVEVSQSTV